MQHSLIEKFDAGESWPIDTSPALVTRKHGPETATLLKKRRTLHKAYATVEPCITLGDISRPIGATIIHQDIWG
jgi:hypothetical protein